MTDAARPSALRVVQWTTGNVGRQAVAAVMSRPDLELVGVFAHEPAKVGRDAAELCALDEPTGVLATGDTAELLALRPDCVVYTPLHLDVAEVSRILRSGINVVTTSEFLTGTGIGRHGHPQASRGRTRRLLGGSPARRAAGPLSGRRAVLSACGLGPSWRRALDAGPPYPWRLVPRRVCPRGVRAPRAGASGGRLRA